jgi:hypothetical protein
MFRADLKNGFDQICVLLARFGFAGTQEQYWQGGIFPQLG